MLFQTGGKDSIIFPLVGHYKLRTVLAKVGYKLAPPDMVLTKHCCKIHRIQGCRIIPSDMGKVSLAGVGPVRAGSQPETSVENVADHTKEPHNAVTT